jgi:hypothetical protein
MESFIHQDSPLAEILEGKTPVGCAIRQSCSLIRQEPVPRGLQTPLCIPQTLYRSQIQYRLRPEVIRLDTPSTVKSSSTGASRRKGARHRALPGYNGSARYGWTRPVSWNRTDELRRTSYPPDSSRIAPSSSNDSGIHWSPLNFSATMQRLKASTHA